MCDLSGLLDVKMVEGWCLTRREGDEEGCSVFGFRMICKETYTNDMEARKRERTKREKGCGKQGWDGSGGVVWSYVL